MKGKYAFAKEFGACEFDDAMEDINSRAGKMLDQLRAMGLKAMRIYSEIIEGHAYGFQFYAIDEGVNAEAIFSKLRASGGLLEGWKEARHVYEFKLKPGDTYNNLHTQGIIIGVRPGKLEEYIRLHDEQPQAIYDLCYQNGFRKSSIFVTNLHKQFLLQFQEFNGEENPELYEDRTYQHWLKITGDCQIPLPGEKFWKPMTTIFEA